MAEVPKGIEREKSEPSDSELLGNARTLWSMQNKSDARIRKLEAKMDKAPGGSKARDELSKKMDAEENRVDNAMAAFAKEKFGKVDLGKRIDDLKKKYEKLVGEDGVENFMRGISIDLYAASHVKIFIIQIVPDNLRGDEAEAAKKKAIEIYTFYRLATNYREEKLKQAGSAAHREAVKARETAERRILEMERKENLRPGIRPQ